MKASALLPSSLCMLLAALAAMPLAHADEARLRPPVALVLDNVPAVPARLVQQVAKYNEFKSTSFVSWDPARFEMIVSQRNKSAAQLFRLSAPGAEPQLLTRFTEPVRGASFQPKHANFLIFNKDAGGNEVFRTFRRDLASGVDVALTPEGRRVQDTAWSRDGRQFLYVSVPVNRTGSHDQIESTVSVVDPLRPDAPRTLATFPGGGWGHFHFSPDGRQLVYQQTVSATDSTIWLMDLESGKSQALTEAALGQGERAAYSGLHFTRDGKGLYTISDQGSEFKRLLHIDLATHKSTVLTPDINWDVQSVHPSPDGSLLAFIVNQDGNSVLHLMRSADRTSVALPTLPAGTIQHLAWYRDNRHLGLSLASAKSPAETYSIDLTGQSVTRWSTPATMGVDAASLVEPELVRWKSFDGRAISGFAYRAPAAKFPGKRPVLIMIHGGPESQFRPGFGGRNNYLTNEMGITLIHPNVRGSAGYGKSFLKLDNGLAREDSVRDIGALLDWIATQPDLDATRVAVQGGSYGGYMSLAVSAMYAERITAAIDVVGISNFVTFLEKTESYRRDLRRVEYGDERQPEMRAFMEKIAPLNNAARITKPLFVVQGRNDPRVPYHEAEQIVATVKKNGIPVWYMLANDEGHGFGKKANADYQFYSMVGFLNTYLLGR